MQVLLKGVSFAWKETNNPTGTRHASLTQDFLDPGIQRLSLRRLAIHSTEAGNVEFLARFLNGVEVLLEARRHQLLGPRRAGLAHELAVRVLHQGILGQAARSFLLSPTEHRCVAKLAACDLAHL